jgi:predicted dehydrogenase
MDKQSRRVLLKGSAAAMTAFSTPRSLLGANDRIVFGVIGCGGRGRHIMAALKTHSNCAIAAVCDVYKPNLQKAESAAGSGVESYGDYRRILDRKDIDAVVIATPDHWHGPITVQACGAGKDVYVEKPLASNIEDGQKMVEAARKYRRVVQVGLQQRSMTHYQEACKLVQGGLLGPITHAFFTAQAYPIIPAEPPQSPPPDLDWEMFQGPAPRRPYTPTRQRSWRTYWEYSGGLTTDWGVHMTDVVHWYLGVDAPRKAAAVAAILKRPPDDRVPDTISAAWTYDKFIMSFSNWTPASSEDEEFGNYFWSERGLLFVNRSGYWARPTFPRRHEPQAPAFESVRVVAPDDYPSISTSLRIHVGNLLECIASRQKPSSDVEIGFHSTLPTLLAVLSMRQGKIFVWDGKAARPA